jgi:hypothetical protein
MYQRLPISVYKMFSIAIFWSCVVLALKWIVDVKNWEILEQTSMHNTIISSAIFVMGFMLSATIADFKESERIPAEFASAVEDIYSDAKEINKSYPDFSIDRLRLNLIDVLKMFRSGTRSNRRKFRSEISELQVSFGEMERAGVPPNFVTKLKQQESVLLRNIYRVNYIQKIRFVPSAYVLMQAIVVAVIVIIVITEMDSRPAGYLLSGFVSFLVVYLLMLIHSISVPFGEKGRSMDDVSLFLIREVRDFLEFEDDEDKASNRDEKR